MIEKGQVVESLDYWRFFPLFTDETDDADLGILPQWSQSQTTLPDHHKLSRLSRKVTRNELQLNCPAYSFVVCAQLVIDEENLQEWIDSLEPSIVKQSDCHWNSTRSDVGSYYEKYQRIHERITLKQFTKLYDWVNERIHIVSVEHPMHTYASKGLPRLSLPERRQVGDILDLEWPRRSSVLGLMKEIQDAHPSARKYAVLLEQPCRFPHSCFATATLEWRPSFSENEAARSGDLIVTALYGLETADELTINLLDQVEQEIDTVEMRQNAYFSRTGHPCCCDRCRLEGEPPYIEEQWAHATLARFYMTCGRLKEAKLLYDRVLKDQQDNLDAWHALGAIELSHKQKHFLEAQKLWAEAIKAYPEACRTHAGLFLQAEKLRAYDYLGERDSCKSDSKDIRFSKPMPFVYSSSDVVPRETCCQILEWAEASGGWTRNRHYAVPTHDIPVHTVPTLLDWFRTWFENEVCPLLALQFGISNSFYVHDAFIVKYQATEPSNYLPLHLDESTHSFVLALNDSSEYQGGGTYFYDSDMIHRADIGSLVSFRGDQVLHGGEAVTEGVRYILAGFLYHDDGKGNECNLKRDRAKESIADRFKKAKSNQCNERLFAFT